MKRIIILAIIYIFCMLSVPAQNCLEAPQSASSIVEVNEARMPVSFVGKTLTDLRSTNKVEEVMTGDGFAIYECGDWTFRIEKGIVTVQSISIIDDTHSSYDLILSQLSKTAYKESSHISGGNIFKYDGMTVTFDDYDSYQKLVIKLE